MPVRLARRPGGGGPDGVGHRPVPDRTPHSARHPLRGGQGVAATVFWNIRAPRVVAAMLLGAALAAAGAAYQGMFRNPLAAPDLFWA